MVVMKVCDSISGEVCLVRKEYISLKLRISSQFSQKPLIHSNALGKGSWRKSLYPLNMVWIKLLIVDNSPNCGLSRIESFSNYPCTCFWILLESVQNSFFQFWGSDCSWSSNNISCPLEATCFCQTTVETGKCWS
ncbi:hypothetical protein JTB14_012795 [Gonioctena quinquepunctata]|nr:hypothetical protein JTB14_012795 [Gonioctena quinquepunctata]